MTVIGLLAIIGGGLLIVSFVIGAIFGESNDTIGVISGCGGILAILMLFACFFTQIDIDDNNYKRYDRDTIRLCAEKGGMVSDKQMCIKNNRPIEFERGVWQR